MPLTSRRPAPDGHGDHPAVWSAWEASVVSLTPNPNLATSYSDPRFAIAFAELALHCFAHGGWLDDEQLCGTPGSWRVIPGRIVQGRYDVVCPPVTVCEPHQVWPDSTLTVLPKVGHAITDLGVLDALVEATDAFRS